MAFVRGLNYQLRSAANANAVFAHSWPSNSASLAIDSADIAASSGPLGTSRIENDHTVLARPCALLSWMEALQVVAIDGSRGTTRIARTAIAQAVLESCCESHLVGHEIRAGDTAEISGILRKLMNAYAHANLQDSDHLPLIPLQFPLRR